MSSSGLSRAQADAIASEVIAAWPGSVPLRDRYSTAAEGSEAACRWDELWPSPAWRRAYLDLRRQLLTAPASVELEELSASLFALQVALRDALEKREPPPDVLSLWEQSFAALGRAAERAEAAKPTSRAAGPKASSRRGRKP